MEENVKNTCIERFREHPDNIDGMDETKGGNADCFVGAVVPPIVSFSEIPASLLT